MCKEQEPEEVTTGKTLLEQIQAAMALEGAEAQGKALDAIIKNTKPTAEVIGDIAEMNIPETDLILVSALIISRDSEKENDKCRLWDILDNDEQSCLEVAAAICRVAIANTELRPSIIKMLEARNEHEGFYNSEIDAYGEQLKELTKEDEAVTNLFVLLGIEEEENSKSENEAPEDETLPEE